VPEARTRFHPWPPELVAPNPLTEHQHDVDQFGKTLENRLIASRSAPQIQPDHSPAYGGAHIVAAFHPPADQVVVSLWAELLG
jgi:hypothetical protein